MELSPAHWASSCCHFGRIQSQQFACTTRRSRCGLGFGSGFDERTSKDVGTVTERLQAIGLCVGGWFRFDQLVIAERGGRVAPATFTTVTELLRLAESFPEQAQARLRKKLFRPMPELQASVRQPRLEPEFPPQLPQPFQQEQKFPQRIQRRFSPAAQFQLPRQLHLPPLVLLQLSFSPVSPVWAAAFWRCPSGRRQIPKRGPDESASANPQSRRFAPASARPGAAGIFVSRRPSAAARRPAAFRI